MLVDEHSWPEWVTFSTTATTGRCPWLACVAAPTVYCLFIRTFSSFICHPISSQNEPLQAVWVLDHSDTRRPPCWGGSCGSVSVDHLGRLENLVCVTSWCGRWAKSVDVAAGTEKKNQTSYVPDNISGVFVLAVLIWLVYVYTPFTRKWHHCLCHKNQMYFCFCLWFMPGNLPFCLVLEPGQSCLSKEEPLVLT